jgi:hypothetical protein
VTDKIQKNEVAQDSALTNLQAQNKSLAAQLNRLQLQIADLNERNAYYATDPNYSLIWTSSTGSVATGVGLSFTISKRRRVLVRGKIDSYLEINATGSRSTLNSVYIFGLPSTVSGFTSLSSLGSGASVRVGATADGEQVFDLPAGTYNLSLSVAGSASGGAGTSGTIQAPSIFVQVMDVLES